MEIKKQIRKNLIALLSLTIAISALGYNSWRNELSEQNRNTRAAGFEIIKETAKLQSFLDHSTYGKDMNSSQATLIEGWVRINLIRSLSTFMNDDVKSSTSDLFLSWQDNWQSLKKNSNANQEITDAVNVLIEEVNRELVSLY